jgi:23S rRNA (adenine2503-C2)-methyltransferase
MIMTTGEDRISVYGSSRDELIAHGALSGEASYRADQILSWIYARERRSFEDMSDLSAALRARLARAFSLELPAVVREVGSPDGTKKLLLRLADHKLIETVLLVATPALYGEASDRRTLCVSTQVGCAFGCRFCASGLRGWTRHLEPDEIVAQVLVAQARAGERIDNLVFMGMGEPLANYDSLMRAIAVLNAPWGVGIGARRITISTSGVVPGILRLADQPLQLRLAISLHGATDEIRSQIMPINKRFGLGPLIEACHQYTTAKKQYLTFEYILIEGLNDDLMQAKLLADLVRPLRAKVNLIPYNRVEGLDWKRPSEPAQERFLKTVLERGVKATLRREKGGEIEAACGQLRLQVEDAESGRAPATQGVDHQVESTRGTDENGAI